MKKASSHQVGIPGLNLNKENLDKLKDDPKQVNLMKGPVVQPWNNYKIPEANDNDQIRRQNNISATKKEEIKK